MDTRLTANKPYSINRLQFKNYINHNGKTVEAKETSPVFEKLAVEGGEDFYNYIEWLGLTKDSDMLVLSSMHHYYYDAEELKNIKTVVNLKPLNSIKDIKSFFHTIYNILPHKVNFIGCFINSSNNYGNLLNSRLSYSRNSDGVDPVENGISSSIPLLNLMFSFMDFRTSRNMTKRSVRQLLEEYGLRVLDITEINGLTYFHSQQIRKAVK
jgi:hypothetical protein